MRVPGRPQPPGAARHAATLAGERTDVLERHAICPIPDRRHSLHADEDSLVLLGVAVPQRAPGQ